MKSIQLKFRMLVTVILMMLSFMPSVSWADPVLSSDGFYELSTAEDLYWFAGQVNEGETSIYGRLTNDITVNENVLKADGSLNDGTFDEWTPIGNFEYPFYGYFEGGAHTISGLVVNNTVGESLAGFFGVISGDASVNMLNIKDSYFSGGACGAIVAAAGDYASISYCANIGCTTVPVGDEYYNGGIVGLAYSLKLEGCFSTGSAGNLFGGGSYVSSYNCYYLSEQTNVDGGMTEEFFKNGYVCYLLNNKETNSDDNYIVWRQTVGTDNYPVFDGPIVTGEGLACPHIFNEDYVCDICGEEKTLAVDEDGICRIRTAEELFLFARMVNRGNSTAKAMLMNDIVVNENVLDADGNLNSGDFKTWTPIGNGSYSYYNSFSGTFDGQGYTISGLYCADGYQGVGLFGFTGGAVIKNVKIVDSYFKGTSYVGGIVGCNRSGSNTTVVTGCTFNGTLKSQDNIGGICGRVYSNCKMEIADCDVYGHINASGSYSGGVCGFVNAVTIISNCNVFANIDSRSEVGGICGYINDNSKTILDNCSYNGTISATSSASEHVGGIVGHQNAPETTISGCTVSGTVKSTYYYVGGIVGTISKSTTISQCSVSGATISGSQKVGGIVGYVNFSSTVSECSVSDNVTISGSLEVGGIVGCIFNSSANVSNCSVNAKISGSAYGVGGVVGHIKSTTADISGCNVSGLVSGTGTSSQYVGGIVGYKGGSYKLTITDCQNSASVTSVTFAGGIIGSTTGYSRVSLIGTRITNCHNSGIVKTTGSYSTNTYTGGIVGYNGSLYSSIYNCANTGSVTTSGCYAAGIVGYNNASLTIEKCYNSGSIQSYKKSAGICYNYSYGPNVTNCYNGGTVRTTGLSSYTAGVLYNESTSYQAKITNCYNVGTISPRSSGYAVQIAGGYCSTSNSYYLNSTETTSGGRTAEQFADGRVCYELNNKKESADVVYRQGFDDEYPSFEGPIVTYNRLHCTNHQYDEWGRCTICGAPKELEVIDGYCVISNKADLYAFALKVNKGADNLKAKLANDIVVNENVVDENGNLLVGAFTAWKPVGTYAKPFKGEFDGQGHTISGLYYDNVSTSYVGFFGNIETAIIKNVVIKDSYFRGSQYVGAVSGQIYYNSSISHCGNENTTVISNSEYLGGIAGYTTNSQIDNCYNSGLVKGVDKIGGITYSFSTSIISNCFNIGEIVGGGHPISSTGNKNKCYYLSDKDDFSGGKTEKQFRSGMVCWLLNNRESNENVIWRQKEGELYPSFEGDIVDYKPCTEHHFDENNVCTVCDALWTPEQDGDFYLIGNVKELYWFNEIANKYDQSISARVIDDIVVNENLVEGMMNGETDFRYWKPIANYRGTFDGGDHTISGIYVDSRERSSDLGFFGYCGGCTIKNVKLEDAFVVGGSYTGGISGELKENGTIENCTFNGMLSTSSGINNCGGIVGNVYKGTIKDCVNNATLNVGGQSAGIVGFVDEATITDCVNNGSIKATGDHVGGICGYSYDCVIRNCANYADIYASSKHIGGIIGNVYGDGVIIDSCSNYGSISGNSGIAGVVGYFNYSSTECHITNCYNEGNVSATAEYSGGIVGYVYSKAIISKCVNKGNINSTSYDCGGIAGYASSYLLNLSDCTNYGDVTAKGDYVGGIIGNNGSGINFEKLYNYGNVTGIGYNYVGGLIGYTGSSKSSVLHGTNAGCVKGNTYIGGLVGYMQTNSSIRYGENTGRVEGYSNVGGVVGYSCYNSTIDSVISSNTVKGTSNVGGVCGYTDSNHMINCVRRDSTILLGNLVGGIAGYAYGSEFVGCRHEGVVVGSSQGVAGICPCPDGSTKLINCVNTGLVKSTGSTQAVAGICVTLVPGSEITNCRNEGTIDGRYVDAQDVESSNSAAGVAYNVSGLSVTGCVNAGDVFGSGYGVAGICVQGASKLEDCVNTGNISATNGGNAVAGICVTAAENATITNCRNEGNVDGRYSGGALSAAGICYDAKGATISNCSNSGMVYGQQNGAAGITLFSRVASITDCENSGDISGYGGSGVAGICVNGAEVVSNCTNTGMIKAEGSMNAVAGICCQTSGLDKFTNCHNEGVIDGRWQNGAVAAAGICAYGNTVEFDNCNNSADVYGAQSGVAGIALQAMTVKNSSNTGNIKAEGVGAYAVGIVGNAGIVTNCHNDGVVDGRWANGILSATGICNSVGQVMDCSNTGDVYGSQGIAAGVCGSGSYVSNCSNSGDVYGYNTATTAGICSSSSSYVGKCYNAGNITTDSSAVGGVVGCGENNCYVIDCYNLGVVKSNVSNYKGQIYGGGICGILRDSVTQSRYDEEMATDVKEKVPCKQTISNCYSYYADCLNQICPDSSTVSVVNCYFLADKSSNNGGRIAEQFADGTVTKLLNAGRCDENMVWFQNGDRPDFEGDIIMEVKDELMIDGDIVTEVVSGEARSVRYVRSNITNNWGTLCLPFAFEVGNCNSGVSLFEMNFVNGEMNLTQVNSVRAGQPVLFYMSKPDKLEVSVSGSVIPLVSEAESKGSLVGTFDMINVLEDEKQDNYYIKSNKFWLGLDFVVTPFHAYVVCEKTSGLRAFNLSLPEQNVAEEQIVSDKKIYAIFNAAGQRVEHMQKNGVYVIVYDDGTSVKVGVSE